MNRTVNNVTISGSILPDLAAPLAYRDIGNNTTQSWNNLYLSGQVTIKGGTPGVNKVLTSDALGLATWQDVPASTNNWSTTGNTGTVAGTNFIGTTDNIDLVFKRNNIEGMRLSGASGNLVTTADATINDITVGRGGGNIASNTANGYGALAFNTTGTSNTANGLQALYFNATGINNTANGQRALF